MGLIRYEYSITSSVAPRSATSCDFRILSAAFRSCTRFGTLWSSSRSRTASSGASSASSVVAATPIRHSGGPLLVSHAASAASARSSSDIVFSSGSRSSSASVSCSLTCSAAASSSEAGSASANPSLRARATNAAICSAVGSTMYSTAVVGAAGASSRSRVVNSSSVNNVLHAATSGACVRIASGSNSSGTSQWIVTSSLLSSTASRLFCNDSRYVFRLISSARSSAASALPNCWISSTDPLSPIPGAPGMLSIESPRSAITSTTFSGGTPSVSITFSRSRTRLSFTGLRIFTRSFTSCIMSLSFETTNTGCPASAAFAASVPITSSASKPCASRIGIRNASSARRTYGSCCARSGGIASRFAL